jgi:hypothetical protein
MKLNISYYPSDDILLLDNGCPRAWGTDVANNVIVYADAGHNPVAIEVSGPSSLLWPVLYEDRSTESMSDSEGLCSRPDENNLDRMQLRLVVKYDRVADVLTLECGLPTPFDVAIADGLTAFYDGEDEYGKYINAVRLENAAKLLKPYLPP